MCLPVRVCQMKLFVHLSLSPFTPYSKKRDSKSSRAEPSRSEPVQKCCSSSPRRMSSCCMLYVHHHSSVGAALDVFHEALFLLLFSSSSIEKTRSLCSSSILLVLMLTGEDTALVRSRRLLPAGPVDDDECRADAGPAGCNDMPLSC